METTTNTDSATTAPAHISLIRSGPFYRFQEKLGLVRPGVWNSGRRILIAIAIGWLPLVLIRLVDDPAHIMNLIRDYRIASRLLVAVPILLLAQPHMELRFHMLVKHIRDIHLLEGPDLEKMNKILAGLGRLGDSIWPELFILVAIFIQSAVSYKASVWEVIGDLSYQDATGAHLTPTGWYAFLVSANIFQFLVLLNVWKWVLWVIFSFKLSRLNLRLVPSHPDGRGGLGFFALAPQAFAPVTFAIMCVIGSTIRNHIMNEGAHLRDFTWVIVAVGVVVFVITCGPAFFFVPRLLALRRDGILDYSLIGHMQSEAFHEKWVLHGEENKEDIIAAPEMSTLCDYNSAYGNVEDLLPFPIDKVTLAGLVISIALPLLPAILAEIPLKTVVEDLFDALK